MTRTVRLAVLPVAAALLLSGCGEGVVQPGAAATVGRERISTVALQEVVDRGLADEAAQQQLGADRPAFQRQVLSRLINGDLLRVAARERGVSVSEGEVDARIDEYAQQLGGEEQLEAQAAQSGIAPADLRPFIREITLNDKLADELTRGEVVPEAQLRAAYQQNLAQFDQVRARHILVKTAAEAQQVLAQVRSDPSRFAEIAQARSLDEGSKARGGELDAAGRGAYVKPFEDALFAAKPNQPGVVQTEFGFHVYELLERRTTTFQQAEPALRRQLLQPQRQAAVGALLRETAEDEKIEVNPRFGRWDAETGSVVEAAAEGDGVVSSPGAGAGATEGDEPPGQAVPEGAPEGTVPEGTTPEGTDPGATAPEGTDPGATAPEGAAPEGATPVPSPR